ncbi:hypothetical protein ERO13_A09G119101v2 [Gossypium hirsutum]|nr:hypothetical protein ERO13_A09G119101v2 [Gossypium hirsutum]
MKRLGRGSNVLLKFLFLNFCLVFEETKNVLKFFLKKKERRRNDLPDLHGSESHKGC